MTGYQEILTDPSYHGQMVAMTYPEIGNVGVNREDVEARAAVRRRASSSRSTGIRRATGAPSRASATTCATHGIVGIARHRHARARPPPAHARRAGRRSSRRSISIPARLVARAKARPGLVGRDLVREVTLRRAVRLGRAALAARGSEHRRAAAAARRRRRAVRRRLRLRHQAQHPAQPRERRLPRAGRAGDDARRRRARAEARRRLPLERSRRSRRRAVRARERRRADRQGADLRHLPRPPDPRARARRQDLQAQVRPPRRQPSGDGHDDRQGRDHLAEPRLRGRRRLAAGQSRRSRT